MKFFSFIHLLLLAYIIAALSFWWLSLERQSRIIYQNEIIALKEHINQTLEPQRYAEAKAKIEGRKSNRSKQYLGEGLTFLLVIMVGSFIVYSTYRFNNKLSRQQNNFMLSVTHELKSPIAAMKLTLQTLQRHQINAEKQQQLLDKCVHESDRLNDLCNNILIASQMEGGQYKNEWQNINLSQLLDNTFETYQNRYPKRFSITRQKDIQVTSDAILLQLALNNLIENALKYTPKDSLITLKIHQKDRSAIISVEDQGRGIPDEEKKKIFNQFYRIGDEQTRNTKGTGLGLYLSRKIVKSLGGQLIVKDNKPQGAIFEIKLPIKQAV